MFVLKPSLKHIALVNIVVSLWNQDDIKALIANLNFPLYIRDEDWQKIEDRVIEKVPQLLIPSLLKEKLVCFVKPIGLQIAEWIQHNCKRFHILVNVSTEICWTSHGTIDRKKTAEMLINDENIDISCRFRLAYVYCLEDNIPELWKKMSEDLKGSILDGSSLWTYERTLVSLWTHAIKQYERHNELFSYQIEFESYARDGNKAAAAYFLQKLSPTEREQVLVRTAKCVSDADVLCFLLLQMNREQQAEIFQSIPYKILVLFLDWPFQAFFKETTNFVWEFLYGWHYVALLERIVGKIKSGCKDWNYKKLFTEFLQKNPNTHFITNKSVNDRLLSLLLQIEDKEITHIFLRNASPAVKNKLMCGNITRHIFLSYSLGNDWDLLEIFIQEFLSSKDEIIRFKEELETNEMSLYKDYPIEIKCRWNKLFEDSVRKYDKRKEEVGESSSSKRLCTQL